MTLMTQRIKFATLVLAAALTPTAAVLASDDTGRSDPPPTRPSGGQGGATGDQKPGDGSGMRGPRVPGEAGKGDRGFNGDRGGKGARQMMRGGEGEAMAWLKALDEIQRDLSEEQQAKIKVVRDEWKSVTDKWREGNATKMRDLQKKLSESRKGGSPADPVLMDQMRELIESRPKFDEYQRRMTAQLNPRQQETLKAGFAKQLEAITPKEGGPRGRDGAPGRPGNGATGGKGGEGGTGGRGQGGRGGRGGDGAGTGSGDGSKENPTGGTGGDKPASPPAGR